MLQWGRDVTVADRPISAGPLSAALPGFNGAATLPSRIACRFWMDGVDAHLLQWGRDVTVADRRLRAARR